MRERFHRLSHIDRKTGEPAKRYEHGCPGSLIHVDVKKLGITPDGGGWRAIARAQGGKNRAATPGKERSQGRGVLIRHAYVRTVIDDHSRVAYAEIHDDERAETAIGVLPRAVSRFRGRGVRVERVLSDNGSAYQSRAWRAACSGLGIAPKRTRPYRPQRNGKIERFRRTLAEGWAHSRHCSSAQARRNPDLDRCLTQRLGSSATSSSSCRSRAEGFDSPASIPALPASRNYRFQFPTDYSDPLSRRAASATVTSPCSTDCICPPGAPRGSTWRGRVAAEVMQNR